MLGRLIFTGPINVDLRFPQTKKHAKPTATPEPNYLVLQRPGGIVWQVDLRALLNEPNAKPYLHRALLGKTITTYDGEAVVLWCIKNLDLRPSKVRCIRTAVRLLTNGTNEKSIDLAACIQRYRPTGKADGGKTASPVLTMPVDQLNRRTLDRITSFDALAADVTDEIDSTGLTATWTLENDVLPAIAAMKSNGIYIDRALVESLAEKGDAQAKSLLSYLDPETSRIHSCFDSLGTVTGRIMASQPALQNTARGPLRAAFTAPEGFCLVGGDYSNIDVRVLAAEADDAAMIDALKQGVDFHRKSAAVIFDKDIGEVTSEERKIAKLLLLAKINGQGQNGMIMAAKKKGIKITDKTADKFHQMIQRDHKGVWKRYEQCFKQATRRTTETRTRIGRRRIIPDGLGESKRLRRLLNTPIQGGTADGMKRAMVLLLERLPAGAKIVLIVHDEFIIECPTGMAEQVKAILIKAMVEGMQSIYPEVSIEVEADIWKTWADKGSDNPTPEQPRQDGPPPRNDGKTVSDPEM